MKRGRALKRRTLSSYERARTLADRVITETLKRDPDRVVRAVTFAVEKLKCERAYQPVDEVVVQPGRHGPSPF
jgi:hypothetical protein